MSTTQEIETQTFTRSGFLNKALYIYVAAIVFFAGFFKIADLDFWWHLQTGKILWQTKTFQRTEIYSFTSAGRPYVDHEWLFQLIQFALYQNAGAAGVIIFKCLLFVATYLLIAHFLSRQQTSVLTIALVFILSVLGARVRFIERPEMFTIFFLVCTYVLIDTYLKKNDRRIWWIPAIIIIWSNVHAAVILGLIVQLIFLAALMFERLIGPSGYPASYNPEPGQLRKLLLVFGLSIACTGLNPCGYEVLTVPFHLTSIINSGLLNNQEWQQPSFIDVPFFYGCIFIAFLIQALHYRRLHIANFLMTAFFGYISLRYVRNVGIFCVLMPLLVAPYLQELSVHAESKRKILFPALAILTFLLIATSPFEFGIGQASYFPDKIVQFTKTQNLQGNMLNSYGFGGYLIWNLYPDRKVFIDGRNEVYLPLIKKLVQSRGDSKNWKNLLSEYHIEYALLNYVDQLEQLTVVQPDNTRITTYAPFSSTHFPRRAWALIYWDDDGMILIKRNAANQKLLSLEYGSVFPEGAGYQESLARAGRINVSKAVEELQRKLREDPSCYRARRLLRIMKGDV